MILIATWGASCTMGAIVGAVVDVPTAIASFVCTSLFICLLFFAAAVARQRCRGAFGRGVRRRMQVLGPHEYCRAGKRRGRHCHCAGVRCCIRRKRCPRCPLTSSWFCGCRRGLLSRSFASRRRLPCAENATAPHYRGPGLYPARCLCRAGRQRLGEPPARSTPDPGLPWFPGLRLPASWPWRLRQNRCWVLCFGHRVLYRFEPHIRKSGARLASLSNESNFSPSWSISSGTMVKLYCSKA